MAVESCALTHRLPWRSSSEVHLPEDMPGSCKREQELSQQEYYKLKSQLLQSEYIIHKVKVSTNGDKFTQEDLLTRSWGSETKDKGEEERHRGKSHHCVVQVQVQSKSSCENSWIRNQECWFWPLFQWHSVNVSVERLDFKAILIPLESYLQLNLSE